MKCPKCNCNNITSETSEKKNTVKRVMYMIGTGALAIGGVIALPIPGLRYVGLGCLAGSVGVGKVTPSKNTLHIRKYKCHNCGYIWETQQ